MVGGIVPKLVGHWASVEKRFGIIIAPSSPEASAQSRKWGGGGEVHNTPLLAACGQSEQKSL